MGPEENDPLSKRDDARTRSQSASGGENGGGIVSAELREEGPVLNQEGATLVRCTRLAHSCNMNLGLKIVSCRIHM